jgi:hypothetical protein
MAAGSGTNGGRFKSRMTPIFYYYMLLWLLRELERAREPAKTKYQALLVSKSGHRIRGDSTAGTAGTAQQAILSKS